MSIASSYYVLVQRQLKVQHLSLASVLGKMSARSKLCTTFSRINKLSYRFHCLGDSRKFSFAEPILWHVTISSTTNQMVGLDCLVLVESILMNLSNLFHRVLKGLSCHRAMIVSLFSIESAHKKNPPTT